MKLPCKRERRKRILIVDDHPIVRRGLIQLISQELDLEVAYEAEDGPGTMNLLRSELPDLAVIDLSLKHSCGMELIKQVHRCHPRLPILVVSMHDEVLYAERTLRAGAQGYVMKHEAAEAIVTAIRHILEGGIYVSDAMNERILLNAAARRPAASGSPIDRLSDRELEVLRLIGQGLPTKKIAQDLCVSAKTVETYRARIKEKLSLSSGSELVRFAVGWVLRPSNTN